MSNLAFVFEGNFGFQIEAAEIEVARAGGALIHSFFRHGEEEETHYAAMPQVVENYHRSGGSWEYSS